MNSDETAATTDQSQDKTVNTSGPGSTKSPYILDTRRDGFLVRMLLMEHFSSHRLGMGIQDYTFVTFKEVEVAIKEC